jgi:hypothetical protein
MLGARLALRAAAVDVGFEAVLPAVAAGPRAAVRQGASARAFRCVEACVVSGASGTSTAPMRAAAAQPVQVRGRAGDGEQRESAVHDGRAPCRTL